MNKLWEFVEDDAGRLSSVRLSMLAGVLALSLLLFVMAYVKPDEVIGIVIPYCGLCAGPYGVAKWQDSATKRASMNTTDQP